MSSDTYSDIVDNLPLDANLVEALARWINEQPTVEYLRADDMVEFLDGEPEAIQRILEVGIQTGAFKRELRKVCCGLSFDASDTACDECGRKLSGETEEVAVILRRPTSAVDPFAVKAVDGSRTPSISPLWYQPKLEEFLIRSNGYQSHDINRGLKLLSESGLFVFRLSGFDANEDVLRAVMSEIGKPTEWQNREPGPIKEIRPKPIDAQGTGDSIADLGFHVDGTQHDETPQFLIFQYISLQKLGGRSVFVDVGAALASFEDDARERIIKALSGPSAGTFSKNGMEFSGPMLFRDAKGTVGVRTRYDSVVEVDSTAKAAWMALKGQLDRPEFQLQFTPDEGDIVVFDNWRLLHAREEIYGQRQRHHRRVWIEGPRFQIADRKFGIPGFTIEELGLLPKYSS